MAYFKKYSRADGLHVRRDTYDDDICIIRFGGRIQWKQYLNLSKEELKEICNSAELMKNETCQRGSCNFKERPFGYAAIS